MITSLELKHNTAPEQETLNQVCLYRRQYLLRFAAVYVSHSLWVWQSPFRSAIVSVKHTDVVPETCFQAMGINSRRADES